MTTFVEFIKKNPSVGYNEELKAEFARKGKAALKEFSSMFPGLPVEINYNKAGIAMSGDFHFKVMLTPEKGVDCFFNLDAFGSCLTYRTIKSFKDYSGGVNNREALGLLAQPETLKSKFLALV